MGWILSGLAEAIVSLIGDILDFFLACFADFELDIGYGEGTSFGDLFSPTYYNNASGLIDSVFPEATLFFPLFTYMGYVIVFLAVIYRIATSMLDPFARSAISPLTAVARGAASMIGVTYSYSIFIMVEMAANSVYVLFKEKLNLVRSAGLPNLADYLKDPSSFISEGLPIANLAMLFIEIGFFAVLIIQFLRLLLEAFQRYVALAVLFYTSPLAFSTIAVGDENGSDIFQKWIRMFVSQLLVLILNLFFVSVFYAGFINIFAPSDATVFDWISSGSGNGLVGTQPPGQVFATGTEFVVKMCVLIAWLMLGQMIDSILNSLGLSAIRTGAGLGAAVLGGVTASVAAIGVAGKAIRGGSRLYDNYKKGEKEALSNDQANINAESVLRGKGDSQDTIRAASTSSELSEALGGSKDAVTADVIGSDGLRPTYNDIETRASMEKCGVVLPAFGKASMTDGKVTVTEGGSIKTEIGDARRWQAAGGAATFREEIADPTSPKGEKIEFARAATKKDIAKATLEMVESLESKPAVNKDIAWKPHTDSEGNETGLAIGYRVKTEKDAQGNDVKVVTDEAVYAAYVDGAATMNSEYGRVLETTEGGMERRYEGEKLEKSHTTYTVQNLQDHEHRTKQFTHVDTFARDGGVKFSKPAENRELVKKSVSSQDAYSYAHASDKSRWKNSRDMKEREIRQASSEQVKASRESESNNAVFYRTVNKAKESLVGNKNSEPRFGKRNETSPKKSKR